MQRPNYCMNGVAPAGVEGQGSRVMEDISATGGTHCAERACIHSYSTSNTYAVIFYRTVLHWLNPLQAWQTQLSALFAMLQ